jgi:hypothetical protein
LHQKVAKAVVADLADDGGANADFRQRHARVCCAAATVQLHTLDKLQPSALRIGVDGFAYHIRDENT